jgi:CobQ-like glutamine amidotransferase family enzyme
VGVIDHPAGQRRELRRCSGGRADEQQKEREKAGERLHGFDDGGGDPGVAPGAAPAGAAAGGGAPGAAPGGDGAWLVSKLTLGADWAPALAENIAMGLSLR